MKFIGILGNRYNPAEKGVDLQKCVFQLDFTSIPAQGMSLICLQISRLDIVDRYRYVERCNA